MNNKTSFKYFLLISILLLFVLQTNYVFAEDFSWKFNNGLPETRNESKELDRFASDVKKQPMEALI